MIPELRIHTDSVLALLQTAPGFEVGDGDGAGLEPPFVVLYRGKAVYEGPLDLPNVDGKIAFQVSCAGETRMAAEGLGDTVRALILGGVNVPGRVIPHIEYLGSRGANRNVMAGEKWFTATEEFALWSTPGGEEASS